MDHGVQIPRYIDSLPQVAWFEVDELLGLFLGFLFGILLHAFGTCVLIGAFSVFLLRKTKTGRNAGYLFHWLWWYGIPVVRLDYGPAAGERILVE